MSFRKINCSRRKSTGSQSFNVLMAKPRPKKYTNKIYGYFFPGLLTTFEIVLVSAVVMLLVSFIPQEYTKLGLVFANTLTNIYFILFYAFLATVIIYTFTFKKTGVKLPKVYYLMFLTVVVVTIVLGKHLVEGIKDFGSPPNEEILFFVNEHAVGANRHGLGRVLTFKYIDVDKKVSFETFSGYSTYLSQNLVSGRKYKVSTLKFSGTIYKVEPVK